MHDLRKLLSWNFAFLSLVCLWIALSIILQIIHRHISLLHLRNLIVPTVLTVLTAVYGAAWWTVWRGKPSGRGWAIAASLTNILFPISIMVLTRYVRGHFRGHFVLLAGGVAGLIAFSRRYEQPSSAARTQENLRIPGDGTSDLVNRMAGLLIFAVGFAAYYWWLGWLRARDFPAGHSFWDRSLMFVLIVFIIVALHELGHTATGLALGMKLRAFLVGPFQWRIRGGKWSFQFNPVAILSGGGATAVVPATADFPRWRTLCMVAAGPLVTLLTGTFAFWIAFSAKGDSATQASAPLPFWAHGAWFYAW